MMNASIALHYLDMDIPLLPLRDGNTVHMVNLVNSTQDDQQLTRPLSLLLAQAQRGTRMAERAHPTKTYSPSSSKPSTNGWRHIERADAYGTEEEVGIAIKESGIPRADFFVTTKVQDNVRNIPDAIQTSLEKLGMEYVDL
jgi:hypothetical protein